MTPKEKAKELFQKMFSSSRIIEVEQSKKCALIAVDEILNKAICKYSEAVYWQEVKQEISNL